MYKKVLLAYDGSIEGRRALREGAKLAQLCRAEVFLLAVVELTPIISPDAGLAIPIDEQTANYKAVLSEGVYRAGDHVPINCDHQTNRFEKAIFAADCSTGPALRRGTFIPPAGRSALRRKQLDPSVIGVIDSTRTSMADLRPTDLN
jgi:hypothetical protein